MADWQEAVQASVIALIFALMVAKLVSVVISFRRNLRLEREAPEKSHLFSEDVAVEETSSSSESENWDEDQKFEDEVLEDAEKKMDVEEIDLPFQTEVLEELKDTSDAYVELRPLLKDSSRKDFTSDVEDQEAKEVELAMGNLDERIVEAKTEREENKCKQAIEPTGELSDSDGWEGVESSELDDRFGAAATFVATQAVGPGLKVPNETQLLLYGLYKIATEGPCSTPQPSAYKISARAKWIAGDAEDQRLEMGRNIFQYQQIDTEPSVDLLHSHLTYNGPRLITVHINHDTLNSWQKLGNIGSEEAMHRYIAVVSEISPSWALSIEETDKKAQNIAQGDGYQRGGMGPVFSTLAMNEEGGEGILETIHMFAREGDQACLQQQIEQGTSVDLKDSDGRTALHWAVDRGHLNAVELLIAKGAQINAKDSEGQTALHYATTCELEEIAKYLVKEGAEPSTVDNEGVSPLSSRPGHWFWMGATT